MFNFDEDKLTDEQIMQVATQDNIPPLRVAINANGYRQSTKYWCGSEEMLCINLSKKYGVVVGRFHQQAINGKGVVSIRSLHESIRKVQPFVGRDGIMDDLRDNIIPYLQYAGIVCLIGDKIYSNPFLVSMGMRDVYKWCNAWHIDERNAQLKPELIHGYDADDVEKAIQFYRKAKSLLNGE